MISHVVHIPALVLLYAGVGCITWIFVSAKIKNQGTNWYDPDYQFLAVISSLFWPIAAPIWLLFQFFSYLDYLSDMVADYFKNRH